MGRPLNKKYIGKRNTGAAGTFGNTNLLPTDYDLGGLKANGVTVVTPNSYSPTNANALTVTFPKPALASEGAVTAVGTVSAFTYVSGASTGGSATKAYTSGAGSVLATVGATSITLTPTLTAASGSLAITATTNNSGAITIATGTFVVGQDVVVTGTGGQGISAGTYYVGAVASSTAITLSSSYANAVAASPVFITTTTGSISGTNAVVGGTYNSIASIALVSGGTFTAAQTTAFNAASPVALTQASSSGTGQTLITTSAAYGVSAITLSNGGNGYINTVPVTPSITSTTLTSIASGAYGTITVGATPFNTITLGTAQTAGTFYVGQVVSFTGTPGGNTAFIDSGFASGNSYLVSATNGTSTLTLTKLDGTAVSGGAAGATTGLTIALYKATVASTDQLVPGLKVVTTGTGGSLTAGTYYIIAVNGQTEIVLSSTAGGNAVAVTSATATATCVFSGNIAAIFSSGSAAANLTFAAQVTTGYTGNYAAIQAVALATTGGVARQDTDIVKQENTQRFRVENADGVFYAKLVNTFPTVGGTMAINAVDSASGTYWVTKITNRRCRVTRNTGTQFTDGSTVNWTFGSAVANVSVKIDNA
jgi:hypothetical protein